MKKLVFILLLFSLSCERWELDYNIREVVITIDDMPAFPENSVKMLDVLKAHNIQATIFCIGMYMEEQPELTKRIIREQTIGNHTYSHPHLSQKSTVTMLQEVTTNQRVIDSLQSSTYPKSTNKPEYNKYFRAPYGDLTSKQESELSSLGYKVTWWDIDGSDWDNTKSLDNIMKDIHKQLVKTDSSIPILLFHLSNNSILALETMINEFESKGIKVISLKERATKLGK
jgi:peptidoglycan/xylan/chitin deacetylase (PgdA/CDA1 family)